MTDQRKEDDAAFLAWAEGGYGGFGINHCREAFAAGRAAERAEVVAMVEKLRRSVHSSVSVEAKSVAQTLCDLIIRRLTSEETDGL